ncbi:hypothetical protein [Propionivibrio sp.]|uniref:hypothetical protein n=1 Tax=Propionivibrio sp. TaxID=2212460 RepID=UPI003BF43A4A
MTAKRIREMKNGPRIGVAIAERVKTHDEINNLPMKAIQSAIRWTGTCRLHMLNEDAECLLSEYKLSKGDSKIYYADASTGLLFDRVTGACRQSSRVTLDIESIKETVCTLAGFGRWRNAKFEGWSETQLKNKRGPKTKEQKAQSEEFEMAEVD